MIVSMTGYGTGFSQRGTTGASVEIRTVNHRFLDIHVRLARDYSSLESEIQQAVRGSLVRGRVDVTVNVETDRLAALAVDYDAVRSYMEAVGKLKDEFGFADALDLRTILSLPGVIQDRGSNATGAVSDDTAAAVREGLRAALEGVVGMRTAEGRKLAAAVGQYLDSMAEHCAAIAGCVPSAAIEYRQKLEDRLKLLLPGNGVDPQRLAQELAIAAEKSDISEELTRLESHVLQYRGLVDSGREAGKKMDFLAQEMQREANTILAKSGNLEITRRGIAIKADIEKLREQVQNVE